MDDDGDLYEASEGSASGSEGEDENLEVHDLEGEPHPLDKLPGTKVFDSPVVLAESRMFKIIAKKQFFKSQRRYRYHDLQLKLDFEFKERRGGHIPHVLLLIAMTTIEAACTELIRILKENYQVDDLHHQVSIYIRLLVVLYKITRSTIYTIK